MPEEHSTTAFPRFDPSFEGAMPHRRHCRAPFAPEHVPDARIRGSHPFL